MKFLHGIRRQQVQSAVEEIILEKKIKVVINPNYYPR